MMQVTGGEGAKLEWNSDFRGDAFQALDRHRRRVIRNDDHHGKRYGDGWKLSEDLDDAG